MTTAEVIAACSQAAQMPFLVIGGHAVIVHGYPRNTFDLDFLVRQADRAAWIETLARIGYRPSHSHENFAQFTSAGKIDLDLMFVNEKTFDGMLATALEINFSSVSMRVPSLEHLVALKLHVLKQGLEHRMLGDLDDVINLILVNKTDLREKKWRHIFEKYGNLDLYEKIRHATQQ